MGPGEPLLRARLQRVARSRLFAYVAALATVGVVLLVALPAFYSPQNLANLVRRSIPLLCVSMGQMAVILIAGIDLSVGAVMSISTAVASSVMVHSIGGAVFVVLVVGALVGVGNGLGTTKAKINPFVMTLGVMSVVEGMALYVRPRPGGYIPRGFVDVVLARWGSIPVAPLIILLLLVGAGYVLLNKTTFGRRLYAIGGNEEAARLAGVSVDLHKVLAYVVCGVFSALGGLYMTARIACGDPTVGAPYLLDSIGAVVIGGTALTGGQGTLGGLLMGVLIFASLGNLFNLLGVDMYWQYVFRGLILVTVVAVSWARAKS